jgi:hypothetical protein
MKQTQWQIHVDAFNKSGLSKREYAENYQLVYHQFLYWSQKLNKPKPDAFFPVTVTPSTASTQLKSSLAAKPQASTPLGILEFPNGIRAVIHSPELLIQLPGVVYVYTLPSLNFQNSYIK